MINERRLVDFFNRLVTIDSLSLKEGKVIKYLEKELKALGLKPYRAGKPKNGEAYNLAVDLPGNGPRLLLNAHVDTVQPGKGIKPIKRKGVIKTNGTTILGADDKAGVAVILEVLKVLKENNLSHPYLRVIFTVAEEIGLLGAMAVPKKLLDVSFGITLDHGEAREIVNKAPSQQNITATIIGKAAHAGVRPEAGINAIRVASIAISKMKLGRIDKETTANVGVIQGGKATNIIPERVEIKGEARSHNPDKLKKQIIHMRKQLSDACFKARARLKIKVGVMYKSFEIKKNEKALKVAFSAARKAGLKPVLKQTGGGSDANIFNAAGVPTVNIGVGMHKVHTTSEIVKIKEMAKGTEIVLNMIKECTK
jgi:tripeptide aminopeptidase